MAQTENRRVNIYINAEDAIKQQEKLLDKSNKLQQKMASLSKETENYDEEMQKLTLDLLDNTKKFTELQDKIDGKVAPSMREMRNHVSKLRRELEGLPTDTQEFIDKTKQLQEAETMLRDIESSVEDTRTAWQKLKGDLKEFGTFAAGTVAGELIIGAWQAITGFIGDAVEKQKELSYKIFDMQKFLGLSNKEAEKLNSELSKIKSVTPTSELRDMAIAAGKLGVPTEQVKGFVAQMDIAQQALAGEFSTTAEETSVKLGKLKGQFAELNTQSWEQALPKISSTLLEAGASGAASAENLTEFGLRMGALGKLGPSFVQNMAVGAVLEEAGLSAEIASGGLSNLFIQSGKNAEGFAKQMGLSKKAVEDLINTSPYDFLKELAKSFQGLDNDQVIAGLNRLGVSSNESVKVLSILRDKLGDVEEKNKAFGKTFDEGTKGQKLAEERMKTFGAQVEEARKEINAFVASIQAGIVPALTATLSAFLFVINAIRELPNFLRENRQWFVALGVALVSFNAQAILANANALRLSATSKAISIATRAWTAAQIALNVVLTANPIGLVVTAVALLVAGFVTAYQKSETFRGVLNGIWETVKVLGSAIADFYIGLTTFDVKKMISAFSGIGEKLGKAYSDGFNSERDKALKDSFAGNDQKIKDQQAKKIEDWKKAQGTQLANAERDNIEQANKARAEALAKGDDKETKDRAEKLKKRLEEEKEAWENINKLLIDSMKDSLSKKLLQIDFDTQSEIDKLKGSAEQIQIQRAIILAKAQTEKDKAIFSSVVDITLKGNAQTKNEDNQADIDFSNEQKNITARNNFRKEAEKQAYLERQAEIYALEDVTVAEREALLMRNSELNKSFELDAEKTHMLSRMELLRQFGLEYSTEYQNLETQLLQNQIAQNELKLAEEKRVQDAKLFMWGSFSSAFGQIQAGINQMGAEGTAFSKALAVAQIAIDTAISISKAIAGATSAAAAGGPAAPFLLAGYIATMVGAVVSGVVGAKKALGEANVPQPPTAQGNTGQGKMGGYYDGSYTTKDPSDHKVVGVVHANEYVIPANLLRTNPVVANFARITEGIRTGRGYQEGGLGTTSSVPSAAPNTTSSTQINISSPELLAEIKAMRQDLQNLRNIVFRGYVVHKDIREMDNLISDLDNEITV